MNLSQRIGIDPYFIALAHWQRINHLRGDSVKSGRISIEGNLGNWTGIQNVMLECIPLALHETSSAAVWLLLHYIYREILGRTRNGDGNPKTYIIYKPTYVLKKSLIKSPPSLYRAREILESKNIIYFERRNNFECLYLNLFPLTWNIENERDRSKIKCIIEKEIGRIYSKIGVNNE